MLSMLRIHIVFYIDIHVYFKVSLHVFHACLCNCQGCRPGRWLNCPGCRLTTWKNQQCTQPCIPPGSLNRVPALAGVKAGKSPLPGGRKHCVISYGMWFPVAVW